MNFKTDVIQKIESDGKATDISIPSGAIVWVLLNDVDFTPNARTLAKEAKREPSLLDGISLKYLTLGFLNPQTQEFVTFIDYKTDPTKILFPMDTISETGDRTYPPLVGYEYLDVPRITNKKNPYGKFSTPINETSCAIFYNSSLNRMLGRHDNILLSTLMAKQMGSTIDWKQLTDEPNKNQYAIFPAHRMMKFYYKLADLDENKQPKQGARQQVQISYIGYNHELKLNDLETIETKYIDAETNGRIALAVAKRMEEKKAYDDLKSASKAAQKSGGTLQGNGGGSSSSVFSADDIPF